MMVTHRTVDSFDLSVTVKQAIASKPSSMSVKVKFQELWIVQYDRRRKYLSAPGGDGLLAGQ
jgi:hypothetical protein